MKRLALLCAVAVAAAVGLTVASPGAAFADSTNFRYQNLATGMCMEPVDGSDAAGAAVVQAPCSTDPAQGWHTTITVLFHPVPVYIVNEHSGLCLDVRGSAINGTLLAQWPCGNISNVKWQLHHDSDFYTIESAMLSDFHYCVDVPYSEPTPRMTLWIWGCNGTAAQAWSIGTGVIVQA